MKLIRKKTIATLLLAVLILTTLFIVPIYAGTEKDVIVAAADRLLDLQSVNDFGWDWIVTDLSAHSEDASSDNLYGATAHGLLDAYEVTGDSKYYDAAKAVADYITAITPGEEDFYRDDKYIVSFDFRFLMRFGSYYAEYISDAWNYQIETPLKTKEGSTLYSFAEPAHVYTAMRARYGDVFGFAVWQASDFGLAAYEMGETDWAAAMAVVIADNLVDMTGVGFAIGAGKALELFSVVNLEGMYDGDIADLVTLLVEGQEDGGYWDYGQSEAPAQDTAYAIMGLVSVGETEVAKKGALWLIETQANGGWLVDNNVVEIAEVNSEAIQALSSLAQSTQAVVISAYTAPPTVSISVLPTDIDFGAIILGETTVFPEKLVITNGPQTNTYVTAELLDDDGFYLASLHYDDIPIVTWVTTITRGGTYSADLSLIVDRYAEAGLHTVTLVFWGEESGS